MKILIIDDNPQARQMIKNNLRNESHEFYECEDGAESLAAYRQFLPDWVLMDWEMKIVNGLTAARLILREFPDAQILIVTNYDENDFRRSALAAGVKGYVLKDDLFSLNSFLK